MSPGSNRVSVLALAGFIGLGLAAGAIAGVMTAPAIATWDGVLATPPGTPPNWVFPTVWSCLYVLIGIAAWLVWRRRGGRRALRPWFAQLVLNFLWSPAFFGLHSPALGLLVIVPLLGAIVLCIRAFARVRPSAAWLMAPYLAWVCYATYLNAGFFYLNPSWARMAP
jgi:tryptophan-rich sensory protein